MEITRYPLQAGMWDGLGRKLHPKTGNVGYQSCPSPCDPMDCGPVRPSVHRILQAREDWGGFAPCPSPEDLSKDPGSNPGLLHAGGFFTVRATRMIPLKTAGGIRAGGGHDP